MIPTDLSPLANHLWQSTLFFVAAWLVTLALKNNRAAVRYWIWLAASVKFLIPFSLLFSISDYLEWRPPLVTRQPQFTHVVDEISRPFMSSATASMQTANPSSSSYLFAVVFGLWFCGFVLGVIFLLRSLLRIRAVVRSACPLDYHLPIPVMSSSARLEPGVFGIRKPILLLPLDITARLTAEQLESVLAHELCHVRRRDNLTTAIHTVVALFFWFHPLVWWIGTQLVAERERACDEEVVALDRDPQVYAEAILKVCKLYIESPLACVSGVTGANLKRRIAEIIADRRAQRLSLTKKLLLASAGLAALTCPVMIGLDHSSTVHAQSTITPTFEAASIKPNHSGRAGGGLNLLPARIKIVNSSLKFCVQMAWNVRDFQVSGGEGWTAAERWDIDAVAAGPFKAAELRTMLQALLADRFGLVMHRETHDQAGYALVTARNGPKLPPPIDDPDVMLGRTPSGDMTLKAKSATMEQLATTLSATLGKAVVDRTGNEGRFDVSLEWAPDPTNHPLMTKSGAPAPMPPPDAITGPSIFTALQQKLGLKLEARKVPAEIIVIDQPSAHRKTKRLFTADPLTSQAKRG